MDKIPMPWQCREIFNTSITIKIVVLPLFLIKFGLELGNNIGGRIQLCWLAVLPLQGGESDPWTILV